MLKPVAFPRTYTVIERFGLLAVFCIVILLRLPDVALGGRFFGEEGTNFFAYAWHGTAWQAFFHPLGGYLNIAASGTTLIAARLVRHGWLLLDHAPYLTIGVSLFFQMIPAILILNGTALWLKHKAGVLFALLALVATPMTEEVWLQTLHIQFHLALCILVMIVTDLPTGLAGRAGRIMLAVIAPLCGPASIVLLPPMALRAWLDVGRGRWLETGALALGAAIQFLIFYLPSSARGQSASPDFIGGALFVRNFVTPLLGQKQSRILGATLLANDIVWAAALGALVVTAALFALAVRRKNVDALLLLGMGLMVAVISYHGGLLTRAGMLDVDFGQRYNFVPQVALYFALIALFTASVGSLRCLLSGIGCLMGVVGIYSFLNPLSFLAKGPDWEKQVGMWRRDRARPVEIWPEGWTMDISDAAFACHGGVASQPSYCDAAWEARQHVQLKED